jgi:Tol biopolymer transport system component
LNGSNAPNTNSTVNIWIANSDGSGAMPLTRLTGGARSSEPVWSPDGKKMAFTSSRALDGSDSAIAAFNLWVMNADGTGAAPLTKYTTAGVLVADPIWAPNGSKIAFSSSSALDGSDALNTNGTVNLWSMNADGSGAAPLTRLTIVLANPSVWPNSAAVWSPDSTRLAFFSAGALDGSNAVNPSETFNLWLAKADGSGTTPLTSLTGVNVFQAYPTWSPDGKKIAFIGGNNLSVINADGSGATQLTHLTNSQFLFYPVWSPDGTRLAFGSDQALNGADALNVNGAENVWTINADGTGAMPVSRLTTTGINFVLPMVWSPDGKTIAFQSQRAVDGTDAANPSGGMNVWIYKADGSSAMPLTRLTANSAESFSPAWKP